MELISTLKELLTQISRVENQSINSQAKLVVGIGNYFYKTKPSKIDEVYVQKTEGYFDELFQKMKMEGYDPDLTEEIRKALGNVSAQCKKIEIKDYSGDYFGMYKLIGEALMKIGELMKKKES